MNHCLLQDRDFLVQKWYLPSRRTFSGFLFLVLSTQQHSIAMAFQHCLQIVDTSQIEEQYPLPNRAYKNVLPVIFFHMDCAGSSNGWRVELKRFVLSGNFLAVVGH